MSEKKRALIVEDDEAIRVTLADLLAGNGFEVETAKDGLTGERSALENPYDIILLDLMLPGRDGYSLCKNIRTKGIETPILMLTARGTNLDIILGLKQGADDYLVKPFDPEVLLARMEALLRRASGHASAAKKSTGKVIRFGSFALDTFKGELFLDAQEKSEPVLLNPLEYKLLEFLACNAGRIIERKEILDAVWGYDADVTTRTLDVHVAKLRQRLGESHTPHHILTAHRRGYKFVL